MKQKPNALLDYWLAPGPLLLGMFVALCIHEGFDVLWAAPSAPATAITLTWTAPGDDGMTGTAAQYDLRYSTEPITEATWNQATQVIGEPTPQPAGTTQSATVTGLADGTQYFFAIKTTDEAGNVSPLSNVAEKTTAPDTTAPAAILDLRAE